LQTLPVLLDFLVLLAQQVFLVTLQGLVQLVLVAGLGVWKGVVLGLARADSIGLGGMHYSLGLNVRCFAKG